MIQMIQERLVRSIVLFFLLVILFWILESIWPSIANQSRWRRGVGLDTAYWFFTPMVSQMLSILAIGIVLIPLFWLLGRSLQEQLLESSYGPLAQLPRWIQGLMLTLPAINQRGFFLHSSTPDKSSAFAWSYSNSRSSSEMPSRQNS